jgi:hypothetical protein
MDKHFYCLENIPDLEEKYIKEGLTGHYFETFKPHVFRAKCSYDESDFIKHLRSRFNNVRSTWLMNPPWSLYDWHIDILRNCSINIPIKTPSRAGAYYKSPLDGNSKSLYHNLIEVKYLLYKPTILNTQKKHCVLNPTDETRIILSISIEDENISYAEVLDYLRR